MWTLWSEVPAARTMPSGGPKATLVTSAEWLIMSERLVRADLPYLYFLVQARRRQPLAVWAKGDVGDHVGMGEFLDLPIRCIPQPGRLVHTCRR